MIALLRVEDGCQNSSLKFRASLVLVHVISWIFRFAGIRRSTKSYEVTQSFGQSSATIRN
jgi:hypothetical protein